MKNGKNKLEKRRSYVAEFSFESFGLTVACSQTTARVKQSTNISKLHELQERRRLEEMQKLAAQHEKEMAAVQARLQQFRLVQQQDENRLRGEWELRHQNLWTRIETVIKQEEDKVAKRLAEEQRKREDEAREREEEERRRKDEEQKKRLAEEKRKAEEERIRREEEEKKRLEEEQRRKEEEEERLREEEERQKQVRLEAEQKQRDQAGLSTAAEDWRLARDTLRVSHIPQLFLADDSRFYSA
jgi:nucleoporin GLE1